MDNMKENKAIKILQRDLQIQLENKALPDGIEAIQIAIKALEKQEKIKEAFEKWKTETGGYYGADDETTRFISTLNQILRSDEE